MAAKRRSEAEWRTLVARWRGSGKSRREFAEERGLPRGTFTWWVWKVGASMAAARPEFFDVVVVDAVAERAPDLIVEVGQARVRVPAGFDAHELRRLVDALC